MVKEGHSQFADLLKDSECNLSSLLSLFDNTLIFLFDSEGRFIFGQSDDNFSLHVSQKDFIGKKVSDIFPSDVSIPFEKAYEKNLRGELAEFSYKLDMKTHSGWFKATCSPIFRQGVFDGSLAVVRDVTQTRNASEALRTSEENYRTLVEMSTMAIAIITDGKLVFANPVTSDISGFSQEELLGKDFLQFLAPAEQSKVRKYYSDRTDGKSAPVIYDSQFVKKDGCLIDVELSVRLIKYLGKQSLLAIMKNISTRKQAERELISIQETLKGLVADRTKELESYRSHLEDVVDERTTRLKNTVTLLRIEIEERILAEEKAEHLNLILKAIRNINLLITRETDPKVIINGACKDLVETRGYMDAWILLLNRNGSYSTASEAKFGKNLEPLMTRLHKGNFTPCIDRSLNSSEPWISDSKRTICFDCPVNQDLDEPRFIMGYKLECHNRTYGVLNVTIVGKIPPDDAEVNLFREVCDDIALALYSIEHKETSRLTTIALTESEGRYKALFENSGRALLFMEEELILDANSKAGEVFACKPSDLIGMRPYELSPPDQPDGSSSLEKAIEGIQAAIAGKPQYFRWIHLRMNGELFPAEISLNAVELGGKHYIQAIVNDITSREQAEVALQKSEKNYRTLSDNVPVGVFRSNPKGGGTLLSANPMMAEMFGYNSQDELLQHSPDSLFLDSESRELFLKKFESDGVIENFETLMHRKDGSEFWASISARYLPPNDKDDSGMIDGILKDISESKLQEARLRKSVDNLEKAMEGTVAAMSLLVEMKDPYTSGHQKGVALLACAIGRDMGLDDDTIDCIRIASTLHDLGKLNVPLEILNKPGPLNEFEMDFLRTHPGAGYDILKAIEFPWPVAEVIHQHHEREDGSGYPRGLKGDEIMTEARIIAVADVVEAVASRRPYRASLGIDVALEIIREGYGTTFNEEVVDSCLKLFNEKGFTLIDHDQATAKADFTL